MPDQVPKKTQRRSPRNNYTEEQKALMREHYPRAVTPEEKRRLMDMLNIDSESKLYNLASRMKVTRTHEDALMEPVEGVYMPRRRDDSAYDSQRLWRRQKIADTVFTPEQDSYIEMRFGKKPLEEIAAYCGHTETAILYRARHLGKRKPVQHWDAEKVAAWLGMDIHQLRSLEEIGIDLFPLPDRNGHMRIELVSTTSIARWLHGEQGERWKRLVEQGADEFFIHEILETVKDLQHKKATWESCRYLSAGHTCMNPSAGYSFTLFCTNNDSFRAGEDPDCSQKTRAIDDLKINRPAAAPIAAPAPKPVLIQQIEPMRKITP